MWNLRLGKLPTFPTKPRIAIETGTCRGNGARLLARHFDRVVTIELSRSLHDQACERLRASGISNVKLLQGDSATLLPAVLDTIDPNEAVFFFLDAHWSGDSTVEWSRSRWQGYGLDTAHLGQPGDTPTAHEQCPLDQELEIITRHCRGPAYVLIDDMKNIPLQGPGLKDCEFPGEDWSHLSREHLMSIVQPRLEGLTELSEPTQWYLTLRSLSSADLVSIPAAESRRGIVGRSTELEKHGIRI